MTAATKTNEAATAPAEAAGTCSTALPVFTEHVVPHLIAWRRQGIAAALVTLVGVEGSSPRRIGSQMAIAETGEFVGYISSGCAEAAIVAEAVEAIRAGRPRTVRYGAGSPYIDVVLPCGSGIDVHFDPSIATTTLEALADAAGKRQPATLLIDRGGYAAAQLAEPGETAEAAARGLFVRRYTPPLRIVAAGRGINLDFLVRFAAELEWEVVAASPDAAALARVAPLCAATRHLTSPADFDAGGIDERTAVVLLFHDHEWEPPILMRCADTPAFYVGVLGSQRTHAQRVDLLRMAGTAETFIDDLRSPVGLDIGAANPAEIALSIAAEILSLAPAG